MYVSTLKLHSLAIVALLILCQDRMVAQEFELDRTVVAPMPMISDGGTLAVFPVEGPMPPQVFTFTGSSSSMPSEQSAFELLAHPSVIKDLEVVDEQLEQVQALHMEAGSQITEQMKGLRDGSISGEEYTQLVLAQKASREKRIGEILLPHQVKRLQQINFQMRTRGIENFNQHSINQSLGSKLGLSKEQLEKLKEKAAEVKKRLAEEYKRMRAEAKEELLGVLTAEQRAKFTELSGVKYEQKAGDWNDYIKKYSPKKD